MRLAAITAVVLEPQDALGGKFLDTLALPHPNNRLSPGAGLRLAVITAVGLEHQAALGGGLAKIAAAKAGIMKLGRPVVLGRQPVAAAEAALRAAADALPCPVCLYSDRCSEGTLLRILLLCPEARLRRFAQHGW